MIVRIDGISVFCRSCGFSGHWNKIARLIGMDLLPEGDKLDPVQELAAQSQMVIAATVPREMKGARQVPLPPNCTKWDGPFRTFSAETMTKVGSLRWRDVHYKRDTVERILWPFIQNGKTVGGTGRILPKYEPKRADNELEDTFKARLKEFYQEHPKYRNLPGVEAKRVLYGYDLYPDFRVVVLVEGPSSAIRLIDAGIPALAILGVENWGIRVEEKIVASEKRALLIAKRAKHVILAFDGDMAGRKATVEIAENLHGMVTTYPVWLPDKKDPGDVSQDWVEFIRSEVERLRAL